jgi:hypothetical protein
LEIFVSTDYILVKKNIIIECNPQVEYMAEYVKCKEKWPKIHIDDDIYQQYPSNFLILH